jgi:hypothetical protein
MSASSDELSLFLAVMRTPFLLQAFQQFSAEAWAVEVRPKPPPLGEGGAR